MKKSRFLTVTIIMVMIMWLGAAVNAEKSVESKKMNEPYSIKKDPFFRIARLIMTKEEIDKLGKDYIQSWELNHLTDLVIKSGL